MALFWTSGAVPILGQSLNPGVVIGLGLSLVGVNLVGSRR